MDRKSLPAEGCAQWREAVSALVDGELSPSEQAALWAHLHACSACRAYYRQLSALQRRLRRTDAVTLWLRAVQAHRRTRRWLVAATVLVAVLSAGAAAYLTRRWWRTPVMTPAAAVGIFEHHATAPPEWQANPSCAAGLACLGERTATVRPQFIALPRWGQLARVGLCECLGTPIALYQFTVHGAPVLLLQFNTARVPLRTQGTARLSVDGQPVACGAVAGAHLLLWQRGQQGFVLVAPLGKVNLFQVFRHIALP